MSPIDLLRSEFTDALARASNDSELKALRDRFELEGVPVEIDFVRRK